VKFQQTPLAGAFVVEPEPLADERGFFARTFCANQFAQAGLAAEVAQCSVSFNQKKGTLRGMHYQRAPHGEAKLIRCTRGAIYDVILDLRRDSPTFRSWIATELSADNRKALFIPEGFAHGFQTLFDATEVYYQISVDYVPAASEGVRWDDPAFQIEWPEMPLIISERDRSFSDFKA